MARYTVLNLKEDVADAAEQHGLSPHIESRFARGPLELEQSGLTYFRLAPGFRPPWGHRHSEQEEIYIVVSGSGRVKVEDEVVPLRQWDAIRVPPGAMHGFEAGDEGAEIIAFGAPNTENKDIDMVQGWWGD